MIDIPKITNNKPRQNESVLAISESTTAPNFRELEWKWMYTVLALVLVSTITGTLFGIYITHALLTRNNTHMNSTSNIESECNNYAVKIISRASWFAEAPTHELQKLELPAMRIIIAHTATENCMTQATCVFNMRAMQTFHMESRGWGDIGYNFVVGGDGAVYIGRGWDIQGQHTKGYNENSICIAFMGTFNRVAPPKRQMCAAQKLIQEGIKLNKLSSGYNLYAHRQLTRTESPGLALFEIIKNWNHWTDQIS